MNEAELRIHRANTLAFIQADPITLALTRRTKKDDGQGGYVWDEAVPVADQVFRMIPLGDVMPIIQTPDGFQRTPTYVLLGVHTSDMAIWDKFSVNGSNYQIVSPIRPAHSTASVYERKGDVALL